MRSYPTPKNPQTDLFTASAKCSVCTNQFLQTKMQSHGTLGQKDRVPEEGKRDGK